MAEVVFHIKDYCPVLEGLNDNSQTVILDDVFGNFTLCGSPPACETYAECAKLRVKNTAGMITVTDLQKDPYTDPHGPYRIKCTGCKAQPSGFFVVVEKP